MTTISLDTQLIPPPRLYDIQAGRSARIFGFPVQLNSVNYRLDITVNDNWESTVIFSMPSTDPGMPVFELSASQTASIGTLLAAASPHGWDRARAATGWYRVIGRGTEPATTETEERLSGHGSLVVRMTSTLTRPEYQFIGGGCGGSNCGCGGNVYNSLPCGCGCSECDHPPVTGPADPCNVLTERGWIQGTWMGEYDPLQDYSQWDVVSYNGKNYAKCCPDGWGPIAPEPK